MAVLGKQGLRHKQKRFSKRIAQLARFLLTSSSHILKSQPLLLRIYLSLFAIIYMAPPRRSRKTNVKESTPSSSTPSKINAGRISKRKIISTTPTYIPNTQPSYQIVTRSRALQQSTTSSSPFQPHENGIEQKRNHATAIFQSKHLPQTPSKLSQQVLSSAPSSLSSCHSHSDNATCTSSSSPSASSIESLESPTKSKSQAASVFSQSQDLSKAYSTPLKSKVVLKPCLSTSRIHRSFNAFAGDSPTGQHTPKQKSVQFPSSPSRAQKVHYTHSPHDYDRRSLVSTKLKRSAGVISKENWRKLFYKLDEFKLAEMNCHENSKENTLTYLVSANEKEVLLSQKEKGEEEGDLFDGVKDFMEMAEATNDNSKSGGNESSVNDMDIDKENQQEGAGIFGLLGKQVSGFWKILPATSSFSSPIPCRTY